MPITPRKLILQRKMILKFKRNRKDAGVHFIPDLKDEVTLCALKVITNGLKYDPNNPATPGRANSIFKLILKKFCI